MKSDRERLPHVLYVLGIVLCMTAPASTVRAGRVYDVGQGDAPPPLIKFEPFSDHDEDANSGSYVRLRRAVPDSSGADAEQVLRVEFAVIENTTLGYQYAGVAFPLAPPQPIRVGERVRVRVHASVALKVRISARDTNRKLGLGPVLDVPAGTWTWLEVSCSRYASVDTRHISSFGLSIVEPAEGILEITQIELPLEPDETPPGPMVSEFEGDASTAQGLGIPFGEAASVSGLGRPVGISDRDESVSSTSRIDIAYGNVEFEAGHTEDVMRIDYAVSLNSSLGYQYAGVAFPFEPAMRLFAGGAFDFLIRSHDLGETLELELVLRDLEKKRATVRVELPAGGQWAHISIPASRFRGIDPEGIGSAAIVISTASEGRLEIAALTLPVREIAAHSQLNRESGEQLRWFTSRRLADALALQTSRPQAVLCVDAYTDQTSSLIRRLQSESSWRQLLSQCVCLRLKLDLARIGETEERETDASGPTIAFYRTPGDEVVRTNVFTPEIARKIAMQMDLERGRMDD